MAAIAVTKGGFWFMLLPSLRMVYHHHPSTSLSAWNEENPDPETPKPAFLVSRHHHHLFLAGRDDLWRHLVCDPQRLFIPGNSWACSGGSASSRHHRHCPCAHELMHQKTRWSAGWAICWMTRRFTAISFEHLLIHHSQVATPRDLGISPLRLWVLHYFYGSDQGAWQRMAGRDAQSWSGATVSSLISPGNLFGAPPRCNWRCWRLPSPSAAGRGFAVHVAVALVAVRQLGADELRRNHYGPDPQVSGRWPGERCGSRAIAGTPATPSPTG